MKLVDLTFDNEIQAETYQVNLKSPGIEYTGVCHNFAINSMAGTYIDFPGHIAETDDGQDAKNYPPDKLFRRSAKVIHLDCESGAVSAEKLAANCPPGKSDALIINALGKRRFDEIPERSVYLDKSAVNWIIEQGFELLISDIYESTQLEGVFYYLFQAGVTTICCPVNLDELTNPEVKITALPLPVAGARQIPCRLIAEC
jgi:kynurenine formamidase